MNNPRTISNTPPEVPDDGPRDPAKRRKRTIVILVLSLLAIIVAVLLIVNELMQQPGAGSP